MIHVIHRIVQGAEGSFAGEPTTGFRSTSPYKAFEWSWDGAFIFGAPMIAFSSSHAERGEKASQMAAESAGIVTYPFVAGLTATALAFIPGMSFIPPGARAMLATVVAQFPNDWLIGNINRGFSRLSKTEQRIRRINMGGDYQDTTTASQLRSRAIQDMSNAFLPARTLLGQEARLFHQ